MNSRELNSNQVINGSNLKKIIDEQFSNLGSGLEVLHHVMKRKGFDFESGQSYSIKEVESLLKTLFGKDISFEVIRRCVSCDGPIRPDSLSFEMRLVDIREFCRNCFDEIMDERERSNRSSAYRDKLSAYRDKLSAYRDKLSAYRDKLHSASMA